MPFSNDRLVSIGLLWLRVLCGTGIAYHGYQKVFGGRISMLTQGVAKLGFPMPEAFAWAAALSEFAGGILLVAGLFTRPAAFFVFVTMTVAAFGAHASDPLQVKELALAYWAMSGALLFAGAGEFGADAKIRRKR
jgi:putative oxidoreductase